MSAWRNISIGDETWPSWQTTILTNGWIFITSVSVLLIIVLQIRTWNFGSMSKILDILIQKVIYSYFTDWFSFFRSHVDLEYPDLDLDRDNWEVQVSSIIGPAHRPLQSIKVSLTLTMSVTSPRPAQHRGQQAGTMCPASLAHCSHETQQHFYFVSSYLWIEASEETFIFAVVRGKGSRETRNNIVCRPGPL